MQNHGVIMMRKGAARGAGWQTDGFAPRQQEQEHEGHTRANLNPGTGAAINSWGQLLAAQLGRGRSSIRRVGAALRHRDET